MPARPTSKSGQSSRHQDQYDNTNHFALFPNDRMREDHQDPDIVGFINIDGVEHWISAWTYWNKDGSLRVVSGVVGDEREPYNAPAPSPARSKTPSKSRRH
jgi:hypothetical protein